ncbi:RDD family protein [Ruegeria sp. A3M17]|uniref:RDD family protein n=1 Tax=Ruegeria sp. A3M17 TaxID=2267229 RepID=UPI000DEB2A1E|nr:RDD family protein [Ruegeria sp. A3M17]RBW53456.1 RDD family protein [Ruegeria sp. A3M17]
MKLWRRTDKAATSSPSELVPPEGVPIYLEVAGLGVRLAAQITDIGITLIAAIAVLVLILSLGVGDPSTLLAIGSLLFFVIRVPYYVIAELAWNGQTLGKRLMKIKVVSHDGRSLNTHALVLRNFMKEAEIFLPATLLLTLDASSPVASGVALAWILGGLFVPLFNRHRQRLGDIMAGTHVIHLPVPVLLKDLAQVPVKAAAATKSYTFLTHQLDHYGAFELQALEKLLRSQEKGGVLVRSKNNQATIESVVEKIRQKIGYANKVPEAERLKFLGAFYNAQREHLEKRQLFGERRKDKHYAAEDSPS